MEEYEKECEKRKARADKFGTAYVEPKLEDYLPWTEVKRMRMQAEQPTSKGFATGIDIMDSEELAKQEARKARFSKMISSEDKHDGKAGETKTTTEETPESESTEPTMKEDPKALDLPVSACWDKEEMLRPQRSDPPSSLWIKPLEDASKPEEESSSEEKRDAAVDDSKESSSTEEVTWVPEKIHLFAIDWAAFKQIRNKDLMAFFTGYGPTYVEWLGDLSCNICFEDKFTAKRALMTLGQEIPSPTPDDANKEGEGVETDMKARPDFGNMMWRFCRRPIRKVCTLVQNHHKLGTAYVQYMQLAVCLVLTFLSFQIANDKHGRAGTIARVLMRSALSTDILQDRPNEWPAPPGGFSSTKVLGPNSDYKGGKKPKNKRKRERAQEKQKEQRDAYIPHDGQDGEHPMLARGLSSGRGGFSVEELENERAKKKAKTSESDS